MAIQKRLKAMCYPLHEGRTPGLNEGHLRFVIVDGSTVQVPGAKGISYRLYLAIDLLKLVMPVRESLDHCPLQKEIECLPSDFALGRGEISRGQLLSALRGVVSATEGNEAPPVGQSPSVSSRSATPTLQIQGENNLLTRLAPPTSTVECLNTPYQPRSHAA